MAGKFLSVWQLSAAQGMCVSDIITLLAVGYAVYCSCILDFRIIFLNLDTLLNHFHIRCSDVLLTKTQRTNLLLIDGLNHRHQ